MTLPNANKVIPLGVSYAEITVKEETQHTHIVINPEVLTILKKETVTISELFVLLSLYHERITLLDIYDTDSTSGKILLYEYQRLLIHGFIQHPDGDSNILYELTNKGKEFVETISPHFELPEDEKQTETALKKLVTEYIEIWPNIKLPSNTHARATSVEVEKRLKSFLKVYKPVFLKDYGFKLTSEDILQATRLYVSRFEKTAYLYMANSAYFIQKKEKSALADEIVAMKNGTNNEGGVDKYTKRI